MRWSVYRYHGGFGRAYWLGTVEGENVDEAFRAATSKWPKLPANELVARGIEQPVPSPIRDPRAPDVGAEGASQPRDG